MAFGVACVERDGAYDYTRSKLYRASPRCAVLPNIAWCTKSHTRWCGIFGGSLSSSTLEKCAQHSVHPTGGSLRVFKQFAWLEAGSGKLASSSPTHQRVTLTVSPLRAVKQ